MSDLSESVIPRHVAIIMDGNGRWAQRRGRPRTMGHKAGVSSVRSAVESSIKAGVEVLSLFAFSSENWRRPPKEVSTLMELFMTALQREVRRLDQNGVRLRVIGELSAFSDKLQARIRQAEAQTAANDRLVLQIAANYGGRWDVTEAARQLARQVAAGELSPEDIDEQRLAARLSFGDLPDPDLFIRTGGECRISNFMLWQLAYTELYFTDALWPDFGEVEFNRALQEFASRQRRFGMTGAQVSTDRAGNGD